MPTWSWSAASRSTTPRRRDEFADALARAPAPLRDRPQPAIGDDDATARSSCADSRRSRRGAALVKVGEDDAHLLYDDPLDALRDRLVELGVGAVLATAGRRAARRSRRADRRDAAGLVVPGPDRRHDGRGRRRVRRRRRRRSCGTPRGRGRVGRGAASRRWMSRPRRAVSRARCCARRPRSPTARISTASARRPAPISSTGTEGNIVDRASGRLEKPVGCALGELPKRPKGSDCKSAGLAFGGSNPSLATKRSERPQMGRFLRFTACRY